MISKQKLFNRMGYAGQLGELGNVLCELKNGLDGKVSMEDGKALSSNDFTDEYKQKLEEISTRNAVTASAVVSLTREEYLALESHDENTLYFVTDELGETESEFLLGDREIKMFPTGTNIAVYYPMSWRDIWELRGDESEEELAEYAKVRLNGEYGFDMYGTSASGAVSLVITESTSQTFKFVFEPKMRRRSPNSHTVEFSLENPLTESDTLIIDGQEQIAFVRSETGENTDITALIDWTEWLTFVDYTFAVCEEGAGKMKFVVKRKKDASPADSEYFMISFLYVE